MDNVYVKKISELPFLSELSGDVYIIVSDNGVMKRVLASDIAPEDINIEQLDDELKAKIEKVDAIEEEMRGKQDALADDDIVEELTKANLIRPMAANSGALFTNGSGKIFII